MFPKADISVLIRLRCFGERIGDLPPIEKPLTSEFTAARLLDKLLDRSGLAVMRRADHRGQVGCGRLTADGSESANGPPRLSVFLVATRTILSTPYSACPCTFGAISRGSGSSIETFAPSADLGSDCSPNQLVGGPRIKVAKYSSIASLCASKIFFKSSEWKISHRILRKELSHSVLSAESASI